MMTKTKTEFTSTLIFGKTGSGKTVKMKELIESLGEPCNVVVIDPLEKPEPISESLAKFRSTYERLRCRIEDTAPGSLRPVILTCLDFEYFMSRLSKQQKEEVAQIVREIALRGSDFTVFFILTLQSKRVEATFISSSLLKLLNVIEM